MGPFIKTTGIMYAFLNEAYNFFLASSYYTILIMDC